MDPNQWEDKYCNIGDQFFIVIPKAPISFRGTIDGLDHFMKSRKIKQRPKGSTIFFCLYSTHKHGIYYQS